MNGSPLPLPVVPALLLPALDEALSVEAPSVEAVDAFSAVCAVLLLRPAPLPALVLVLAEPLPPVLDACVVLPFEELVSPVDEPLAPEVFVVLDLLVVLPVSCVFLVDFSFESSLILDTSILNAR